MIHTIIFDIGNVLANYRWKEYLHAFGFSQEVEKAVADAVFLNPIWKEFDRGVMKEEAIIMKEEYIAELIRSIPYVTIGVFDFLFPSPKILALIYL